MKIFSRGGNRGMAQGGLDQVDFWRALIQGMAGMGMAQQMRGRRASTLAGFAVAQGITMRNRPGREPRWGERWAAVN